MEQDIELFEAGSFQTRKELVLKKALIQLMVRKKHVKYAQRLLPLDVIIVSTYEDPECTAAISFETAELFIGEGFLVAFATQNWTLFDQLDVIVRHELAHNLLMHQVRMLGKFMKHYDVDEETAKHIMHSSLHKLLNIIEDFEISNTRYTEEDKNIMRNIILNGKEIHCLVTEDHNASWANMTLEEMFEALDAELTQSNQATVANLTNMAVSETQTTVADQYGAFAAAAAKDAAYSAFTMPLADVVNHKNFNKYSAIQQKIIKGCLQHYSNYPEAKVLDIIAAIGLTTAFRAYKFVDDKGKDLGFSAYTPEDKNFSIHVLLALIGKLKPKAAGGGAGSGGTGTKYKRPDAYVRGYNTTMNKFCKKEFDSKELILIMRHLGQLGIDLNHIVDGVQDNTPTSPDDK
jgi:hypothetical protein